MYEDCLDSITTKIDSANLFNSVTGELITSFKPEACTTTTGTLTTGTLINTINTFNTLINSVPFVTFDYYDYGSCIKAIDKLNKREDLKRMIAITDVDVKYEKKVFVDETKRDENGNYSVTKKEVPVATIVYFENGSVQTAYCDEGDEFNLEVGISICVTRELMKRLYGISGETNTYNKVIRQGMKAYKTHCKFKEATKKYYAEKEAIKKNKKIKEQKRREKRAAKKKEREIEILAEAIRRANADSK